MYIHLGNHMTLYGDLLWLVLFEAHNKLLSPLAVHWVDSIVSSTANVVNPASLRY